MKEKRRKGIKSFHFRLIPWIRKMTSDILLERRFITGVSSSAGIFKNLSLEDYCKIHLFSMFQPRMDTDNREQKSWIRLH